MEKLAFEKINSTEEISQILEDFKDCLYSLRSGEADIKIMAQKFSDFGVVLKACEKAQNVSFAAFYCNDINMKQAYLSLIAVNPAYRRSGYGKSTLEQVIRYSKDQGMTSLKLEVRKDNNAAIQLYKKSGFQITESNDNRSYFMLLKIN